MSSPEVLHLDRVKFLVEGVVQSASDKDRTYNASILLSARFICPCNANQMRDSLCAHLKAVVHALDVTDLRAWVLDSQTIPSPISE